jgi:uncharacterized protein YuzE
VAVTQQWDLEAGLLYLRLAKGPVDRTVEIDASTNVDLDAAGKVLGIEVLAPGTPWPLARVLRRFPQISEEAGRELAAGYPHPPPEVTTTLDS